MTRMSGIGTEQAAPLAKPMPARMSSYAFREDSMSTYRYMQYGVHVASTESLTSININQYVHIVLGGNWDPIDKKFSSVNAYRQDVLPTRKAFPKETTACIWFTQIIKSAVLQEVQML